MPLDEVRHLPNLYRLFSGSKRYEAFVIGGPQALIADPTMFVEKSPDTHASSDFGLVFAYNIKEKVAIRRDKNGLHIVNETYPELEEKDFNVLVDKQVNDQKLVEHLVDVGTLAKCLAGGGVMLSGVGRDLLNKLCLYHAIGGRLTDEGERREVEVINEFRRVSKLDRRFLDSRIIYEIMGLYGKGYAETTESSVELLSDNVNSAVEFLKAGVVQNSDLRDIVVALIQVQDNPHLFAAFKKNLKRLGLGALEDEIIKVFACFKIAKNMAIGRWLWRRKKLQSVSSAGVFLQYNRGDLEELAFIISFSSRWLRSSEIDPITFVDRVNDLLAGNDKVFMGVLNRIEVGSQPLFSDRIYSQLLSNDDSRVIDNISLILEEAADHLNRRHDQVFQYAQLLELPFILNEIANNCSAITQESAGMVKDLVVDFYHKYWRTIKPHVSSQLLARLIA